MILTKLAENEMPTVKELAREFNVSERTIQKDIRERLSYYPINKDPQTNRYRFDYGFSLKQTDLSYDEMVFLDLALNQFEDIKDINKIKESIYKKLIRKRLFTPYAIKHDDLEDIDIDSLVISVLEEAIEENSRVLLQTQENEKLFDPYKIVAVNGLWFLFGKEVNTESLRLVRLPDIKKVKKTGKFFHITQGEIEDLLQSVHSAYFQDKRRFEVKIRVYPEIAEYFEKIEFLDSQKVVSKEADGSLIVSFEVTHEEDIDNIIKSWLPHIEVIKPKEYKEKLIRELQEYIKRVE